MTYEAQNVALGNQVLSERITPSPPMARQMKTSEQISELAAALAAAQGMMENAVMNRVNPHFKSKYADLAAVIDAARKPLSANGLATVQTIGDGVLHTRLLHTSGQWIASEYPLPMSGRPQEIGSALTYARRYSLSALVGIAAEEDDDATGAEKAHKTNGPKLAEGLTDQQAAELLGIIEYGGRTEEWFCKFAHINNIEELSPDRFEAAKAYVAKLPGVSE